jgi:hypothetical protein
MLNEKLLDFLEVNDIDLSKIKGVNFKVDEKTGYTVYVNLKTKGNNSFPMPFHSDEEKAKRVFNDLAKYTIQRYEAYSKALKGLETL